MGDLTANRPKCLVEINRGETILSRQLHSLVDLGIEEVVITTGPYEEKIRAHLLGRFAEINVTYVNNPLYDKTNYIYSLILAAEVIKEDILLLHGDLVFDSTVLSRLYQAPYRDAALINPHVALPEKDFKAQVKAGLVRKISIDIFEDDCVFLIPIYKLCFETFKAWYDEMKRFEHDGCLNVYAEDALNNLLPALSLHAVALRHEFCMEIDNPEDLILARRRCAQQSGAEHGS